ncbi:hypothetical protein Pcinc_011536 [Petrolisthes cinctipes]|uniref:Uncharacterized protein n=1 Tax=Petrolisthes cinctipes TaxID=88211 RepID=A0AAE1G2X6_PETCI|nr:hypothetical protein Pcinc_011536 [Petrolisthes cinctipes]
MLPRRGPLGTALSKNIAVNQRLADLCTVEGVFFVDPYTSLFGRDDLYQRDGTHLSPKGKEVLSKLMEDAVRRCLRSTRPSMEESPRRYARVTPEKTFAEILKKDIPCTTKTMTKPGNGRV